ncbi:hypothetical protein [Psychrobacillus antarcticus]|uniref:hypothetical protein n=1 Tax=Psychrobacillus antarcticus TaxID=2879115 RepID=UPI0024080353|nr:hypothetical protein [Psychrobacillus antarcticus]
MFSSKKVFLFFNFRGSCSSQNTLITEELEKVTIQCMGSEELQEVTDEKMLKGILKEINNSRREGTEGLIMANY